jgi:hypothetical protein
MSVKWKGTKAIQLQRVESRWTWQRGWETVYIYHGEKALIAAAATNTAYVQYATAVDVVPDRNTSELRVTFASIDSSQPDQYTEDSNVWTFTPYQIQKNIEEHPRYVGLADIASEDGYLQRILLAVEDYKTTVATGISAGNTDADKVFALSDYITLKGTAAQQSLANELAGLVIRGHTTYDVTKYTLQNVKVVPPNTNLTVSHLQTGSQWSTARVIDLIASGTPSVTQSSIVGDLIGTFPTDKWLKQAPSIREINNGKFEIITEFLNVGSDELPTQIYPDYV